MFAHVLVPTDFSKNSRQALKTAVALANREGGRVTVVHVVETLAGAADEELKGFYAALEARAKKQLGSLADPFTRSPVPVETRLVFGNRAAEILKLARALDVDLIVMASRPVDLAAPARGWGTVSQKVALLAQCTVMMVK
jgi:universal stress protein A